MCSLQRPLVNQSTLRVQLEAQAVLGLLAFCDSGGADVVASDALVFECQANPDPVRADFANQAITKARLFISLDRVIRNRADLYVTSGIKPLDALHLASAMAAESDFLCTCDDRFLKKARRLETGPTRVVSPLELVTELQP